MRARPKGKHFFYALLALVAIACLAIFWPFLTVIIIGAALAVTLHPVYAWILKRLGGKLRWAAAFLTVLAFLVVLGIPLSFVVSQVFHEAQGLYASLTQEGAANHYLDTISAAAHRVFPESASVDIRSRVGDIVAFLSGGIATVLTSTLSSVFSMILILLAMFYFLKDGDHWKRYVIELSPLSDAHDEKILSMLSRSVNGVMKGYVLIALIQGVLMGVGLRIFGVPNAALWGVLAGIAAMIPSIGTALVSVPAILYLFFTGQTGPGIGLTVWAVVLVGLADNLLNPLIVGKSIEIPPLLVLFAVLGGLALMGAAGIVIGPLAVSLLYTLIAIYKQDFNPNEASAPAEPAR